MRLIPATLACGNTCIGWLLTSQHQQMIASAESSYHMRAQAPPWASTVLCWCSTSNWGGARCLRRKFVRTSTCVISHAVSTSASLWPRRTSTVSGKQAQVGEGSLVFLIMSFKVKAGKLEPTTTSNVRVCLYGRIGVHYVA